MASIEEIENNTTTFAVLLVSKTNKSKILVNPHEENPDKNEARAIFPNLLKISAHSKPSTLIMKNQERPIN